MKHPAAVCRILAFPFWKPAVHGVCNSKPCVIVNIIQAEDHPKFTLWDFVNKVIHLAHCFYQFLFQYFQPCYSLFRHCFYFFIFRNREAGDTDRSDRPVFPCPCHCVRYLTPLFFHLCKVTLPCINPLPEVFRFLLHGIVLFQFFYDFHCSLPSCISLLLFPGFRRLHHRCVLCNVL